MTTSSWSKAILDAVQEFDFNTAPYGLYSVRDLAVDIAREKALDHFTDSIRRHKQYQEIAPFADELRRVTAWAKQDEFQRTWNLPDETGVEVRCIRLAKIKVRKFGSSYHVDKHENFAHRWAACNLGSAISRLWSDGRDTAIVRAVLFIGFDNALRPFERELNALNPHRKHAERGAAFTSQEWLDVHGRGFRVRAALWTL
jgi:hypothetical protein